MYVFKKQYVAGLPHLPTSTELQLTIVWSMAYVWAEPRIPPPPDTPTHTQHQLDLVLKNINISQVTLFNS